MQCQLCVNNVSHVDYKDLDTLKKYLDPYARISKKRSTGVCARHQRKIATAIKQARFLALLPFIAH